MGSYLRNINTLQQQRREYEKDNSCVIFSIAVIAMACSGFAMENMKNGSRGDEVRDVQEILISRGYLDGGADGIFGRKTEAAGARLWQQFRRLFDA